MPGREPIDLMNEVENVLQIHSYAMNWPIGNGKEFQGVVDRTSKDASFSLKTSFGGAQKAAMTHLPLKSDEAKSKIGRLAGTLRRIRFARDRGKSLCPGRFSGGQCDPCVFWLRPHEFRHRALFRRIPPLGPLPPQQACQPSDGAEIEIDPIRHSV